MDGREGPDRSDVFVRSRAAAAAETATGEGNPGRAHAPRPRREVVTPREGAWQRHMRAGRRLPAGAWTSPGIAARRAGRSLRLDAGNAGPGEWGHPYPYPADLYHPRVGDDRFRGACTFFPELDHTA